MSNPDGGIPALRGGIGLRYSREVFRERFSEGDFTRRYSGAIFGAVFRTAFSGWYSGRRCGVVSGCAIRGEVFR